MQTEFRIMEINKFIIVFALFQICFSNSLLLPNTLLLSESLSQFKKCFFRVFTSKLDLPDKFQNEKDTSFEIEPLQVSMVFCHKVNMSNRQQNHKNLNTLNIYFDLFQKRFLTRTTSQHVSL